MQGTRKYLSIFSISLQNITNTRYLNTTAADSDKSLFTMDLLKSYNGHLSVG